VAQVGFSESSVKLAKANGRLIDMLVSGTADRVEYANRGAKCDGLARCGQQLLYCFLMIAGFAKHLSIEHGQLIRADDQGVARLHRHCLGLGSGQTSRQFLWTQPLSIALVYIWGNRLILVKEPIEQAAPILGRGRQNNGWGGRILHKINCLARKSRSLRALAAGSDIFPVMHFDSDRRGPYHARAMGNPLQDRRPPSELAMSGQIIEFSEKISEFEKLAGIVGDDLDALDPDNLPLGWRDTVVVGRLSFGFAGAQGAVPVLLGRVSTTIDAVCQRCLEALRLPLEADLRLMFGGKETVSSDDGSYEIWQLEEEKFRLLDLVEEALIMEMPLAAMHVDSKVCQGPESVEQDSGERIQPFATLKSQMEEEN